MHTRSLVAIAASMAFPHTTFAQSTFTGVGDLPGGIAHSEAWGVSADGTTVVGHSNSGGSPGCVLFFGPLVEAFTWKSSTGIVGQCEVAGGSEGSFAYDASGDGSHYVGMSYTTGGNEAQRDMVALGDLGGGPVESIAFRVSDSGATAVGRGWTSVGIEAAAFTTTSVRGLGDLPGGAVYSVGRGISGDGSYAVGVSETAAGSEAFRIHLSIVAAVMEPLGDLPGGTFHSDAYGTNADGSVVVGESVGFATNPQAFRWTSAGGMVKVSDGWSRAEACSADGNVIVGTYFGLGSASAMIWDPLNGDRLLEDVLKYRYGLGAALAGWHLDSAHDVSADGRTICGTGTNPSGFTEGWVVTLAASPFQSFCFGDGYAGACPCANESPVSAAAGCTNSFGSAGKLAASGVASVGADTVVLSGSGMTDSLAIYFQGTAFTSPGVLNGDGKSCVSGALIRLGSKSNFGGASSYPSGADLDVSVKGLVPLGGGKRYYQIYYRNALVFCTAATFNLASGIEIAWSP